MASRLLEKIQQMENSRGVTLNEWNRMAAEVHAEAEAKVRKDKRFSLISNCIYFISFFLIHLVYSFMILVEEVRISADGLGSQKMNFLPSALLKIAYKLWGDNADGVFLLSLLSSLLLFPIAFHIILTIIARCLPAPSADTYQNAKVSTGNLNTVQKVLDYDGTNFIFGMGVVNTFLSIIYICFSFVCIWNLQLDIIIYMILIFGIVAILFALLFLVIGVFSYFKSKICTFGYKRILTRIKRLSDSYYDHLTSEEQRKIDKKREEHEEYKRAERRKEEAERAKAMLWALNNKSSFDADTYVSEHCESYKYGIAAEVDVKRIENDSSLTSSQKEAAKSELRRKADMYD